ncbi:S-adenosyl-L-methionine-dependent methyltransferase [Microstroma glucosiphilum]|uniref:tRNA N(3)-methylcytidine methyltransferase n=1 Tax=Pseudomicrostroma glucosiphilum TaxID=1684307 RepID=A0A316U2L8_9BASI|nr:S-adenosyl-L-methionine-dependent methyltransferase [Pseudomicrostroma glucosiphilum]PWN18731.1 S-adenosyl-L-methionine-dependent methyltransferase [Pseudomicrostroma glucosiphilum]
MVRKCEKNAAANWDRFYKRHEDRFFHNRNWTDREFQALKEVSSSSVGGGGGNSGTTDDLDTDETQALVSGSLLSTSSSQATPVLLEVGCGVGNMLYPLLEKVPGLKVHCCDFSSRAVEIVKRHPSYDSERVNAFVHDLVQPSPTLDAVLAGHPFGAPTLVSLIFVLSAIPPGEQVRVLLSLFSLLQPGGTLLFRDYARGDLAQLRFHSKEKWAEPCLLSGEHDYYKRGDGTMSFFFSEEYVKGTLGAALREAGGEVESEEVKVVERIGVNRKRGIELKRKFIQGVWRKKG